jgi:hypothetical protein
MLFINKNIKYRRDNSVKTAQKILKHYKQLPSDLQQKILDSIDYLESIAYEAEHPDLDDNLNGIYYIIPHPRGHWRIYSFFERDYGENAGHMQLWEREVSMHLANIWDRKYHTWSRLANIRDAYSGFPRGRIVKVEDELHIYHGDDIVPEMEITQQDIEKEFHILEKAQWIIDEHERCVISDMELMRDVFKIPFTWPCASP